MGEEEVELVELLFLALLHGGDLVAAEAEEGAVAGGHGEGGSALVLRGNYWFGLWEVLERESKLSSLGGGEIGVWLLGHDGLEIDRRGVEGTFFFGGSLGWPAVYIVG